QIFLAFRSAAVQTTRYGCLDRRDREEDNPTSERDRGTWRPWPSTLRIDTEYDLAIGSLAPSCGMGSEFRVQASAGCEGETSMFLPRSLFSVRGWVRFAMSAFGFPTSTPKYERRTLRSKPGLEALEDRTALSTWEPKGPAPVLNGQTPGSDSVSGRI